MLPNKKSEAGFTLLEVMLAMAIFAIAGVALINAATNNFGHMGNIEEKMFANMVATNQMVELSIDQTWPPKDKKKGDVEMAGRQWFWLQRVVKTADEKMRSVIIEVRSAKDQEKPVVELMTYVAKS